MLLLYLATLNLCSWVKGNKYICFFLTFNVYDYVFAI